ncbi:MAG: PQQ-binding-like beta-propeller repeat protein [Chloroflexaceae bacterium]|nr:PQQ-binding-like beta-propeller repeat protein [Chloroflexaceae bacterium]
MNRNTLLLILALLLLASCALQPATPPAPRPTPPGPTLPVQLATPLPEATPYPTESPWYRGTPAPLVAPLTGECFAQQPFPPQLTSVQYGINAFLFATDRTRVLALTRIGGFTWVRQQIHWRDLEGEREQFVWRPLDQIVSAARANDTHLLLSIVRAPPWATATGHDGLPDDPQDFARFAGLLASRYRGRVAAYQIWNEPNLAHEGGGTPADPAHYLAVLQAGYQAIKAADPCALVVSAALAATHNPDPAVAREDLPYFEQLYQLDNGAFLRAADIVGVHTGAGNHRPTDLWQDADLSHTYFRHIERTRAIMERYRDPRQVWLTEYGWTVTTATGAPPPVSEQEQATYLVDALWQLRQRYAWLSGVFVWNLNFSVISTPDDEKTTYSILAPDWGVRPAFIALQNSVPALREADRPLVLAPDLPAQHAWTFPTRGAIHYLRDGATASITRTLAVVAAPGTLYLLHPEGRLQHAFDAPGTITGAPARGSDGGWYVGDSGSLLTALDAAGLPRWTVRLRSPVLGNPHYHAASDDVAVVDSTGEVQVYTSNGRRQWAYFLRSDTTPLAQAPDGSLVIGAAAGKLYAFAREQATPRRVRWQVQLEGELWAAPVIDRNGTVYVATVAGSIIAVDQQGRIQWQTQLATPVEHPPLIGRDNRLYIADQRGTLTALTRQDGQIVWQYAAGSRLTAAPIQARDGTLYIGTADDRLLAVQPDGRQARWLLLRSTLSSTPLLAETSEQRMLYIPTQSGRLYALRLGP